MLGRSLARLALAVIISWGSARAGDHVIVTGGPSLHRWEGLRVPQDRHDRWWANFVRASTLRMVELRRAYGSGARIVWMVYRPGYRTRGNEDGKPYLSWITDLARDRGASLVWVDSGNDLINALNSRPHRSIISFDYFGHSNRHCFMLDYGNFIMAASTAWLHERDLGRLSSAIFDRNAYCKSWGCHTGESMSKVWRRQLGVPLEGAVGKTDYVVVGHGQLPAIVGRWAR
jgi:hypothetical protein